MTSAISSSECETAFSFMNEIVSPKINALSSEHISSFIFINFVSQLIDEINTIKRIESWIKSGKKIATEENYSKRIKKIHMIQYGI